MLKKNLFLLAAVLFVSSIIYSQGIEVVGKEIITKAADGAFYYPRFSNSGERIVFTTDAYSGIWMYNSSAKTINKLNDLPGAGNEPVFDADDNLVIRSYRFENLKRISSIFTQDLGTGRLNKIVDENKNLYPLLKSKNSSIYMIDNGEVKKASASLAKSTLPDKLVYVENSKIILIRNGERLILEPLGKGNYLWPSISPDGSKLLFTKAGSGTFISDLDGNLLYELGTANYPLWAKDGKWVLYMNDKDDGYRFVSSEIEMMNIDTLERFNLTNTDDVIEMYPDYSMSTDEVVYHTLEGQIIKLKLKFNQD